MHTICILHVHIKYLVLHQLLYEILLPVYKYAIIYFLLFCTLLQKKTLNFTFGHKINIYVDFFLWCIFITADFLLEIEHIFQPTKTQQNKTKVLKNTDKNLTKLLHKFASCNLKNTDTFFYLFLVLFICKNTLIPLETIFHPLSEKKAIHLTTFY